MTYSVAIYHAAGYEGAYHRRALAGAFDTKPQEAHAAIQHLQTQPRAIGFEVYRTDLTAANDADMQAHRIKRAIQARKAKHDRD